MRLNILIGLILTQCFKDVRAAYSFTLEDNLRTAYLGSYNIYARPEANVHVTVALNIITLNSLSISSETMSISGYLTMVWYDQRLNWTADATYKNDIPAIYSSQDYIWRPALIIENSVSDIAVVSSTDVLMRIEKTGSVTWTPSNIYSTHCETDVTFYPFDTQECDVTVTTWGYTSIEISLQVDSEPVRLSYYKANGEWSYEGYSTSSSTGKREGSSTPEITYTLKFKRRPYFYLMNTLIPTILLAFLSAMVFKLPPDSGEKMGYCLTVLLAYAVYLTIVSGYMPSTSSSTSVLSVYLLIVLALGVISVFITIYVLECHHKDKEVPVPEWLSNLSMGCCAKFACWKDFKCRCGRKIKPEDYNTSVEKIKNKEDNDTPTWKDICHILDAFFLRIYFIIIGLLTCMMLLTLIIAYHAK